jgi:hypothetical protein
MADLPNDPYANIDREVSHDGCSSDIRTDQSSPGLNAQKAGMPESGYQSVFLTDRTVSCRLPKHGKALSFHGSSLLELCSICVYLHLLLVLIHVALFVVWLHHFEHRVTVSLLRSGNTSSAIVAISQFFGYGM